VDDPKPTVRLINWDEVLQWAFDMRERLGKFDCLVGIGRGGIPLAVTLSYAYPAVPLRFVNRRSARGSTSNFYVFDGDRESRLEFHRETLYAPDVDGFNRVVVVDDVATYGDTLGVVYELLSKRNGSVDFALFAIDGVRLAQSQPDLSRRVSHYLELDNSKVWLSFPWQQGAV
jgi:hypoxanthine phosphoribosyltransferase